MLRIYIARHGQDQDNAAGILNGHRDTPLTEKGIQQAGLVAAELEQTAIKFTKIYTSPLQRAHITADIIADKLHMEKPQVLPELIERDFGSMTGQAQSRIVEMCSPEIIKTDTVTYFLSPEGSETFPELLERGKRVLSIINAKHNDGNILVVAHGDLGKMIYCAYYDLDWQTVLKMFHFGNSEVILLSPDSGPEEAHLHVVPQDNL